MKEININDIKYLDEPPQEQIKYLDESKSTLESIGESASDIARGIGSGVTMGGLEEIIAAGQATISPEEDEWSKKYRKFLEIQEQKTKEAEERSPTLMMGGEIAGALAPAFLTGGTALGLTGGRAAAQLGGKELLKAAGKAALVEGAFGAGAGGLTGALTSEEGRLIGSTPEERSKLLEDVKSGALTGGVIGAGMGAASPYVSKGIAAAKQKGSELMDKFLLTREMKTAFGLGEQGKGQISSASRDARYIEKLNAVSNIRDDFNKLEAAAAEEFKAPLRKADEMGSGIKLDFLSTGSKEKGTTAEADFFRSHGKKEIADILDSRKIQVPGALIPDVSNDLNLTEAYNLRKKIKEAANLNPELEEKAKLIVAQLDDRIEAAIKDPKVQQQLKQSGLPLSYRQGLSTYSDILTATTESITEKGKAIDSRRRFFHDLPSEQATLEDRITDVVDKLELPGTTSEEARRALISEEGGLIPLLSELTKHNPEQVNRVAQRLGFKNMDDFKTNIVDKFHKASSEAVSSRVTQGEREIASGFQIGDLLSRKPLVWGSNLVGQAKYYTKDFAKQLAETAPGKFSSYVYNMPENKLRSISTRYYEDPKYGKYAKQLANALDAEDNVKKQAVLFALIQQPDFRNKLPDMIGETEDEQ